MFRSGSTYWPASLVWIFFTALESKLVRVIVTPGRAAPDGSVTVPTIVPCCAAASSEEQTRRISTNADRNPTPFAIKFRRRVNTVRFEFHVEFMDRTPDPKGIT